MMHRRGAGIAAIKNKGLTQAKFKDKGSEIASEQLVRLSKHLDSFKTHLEDFARKHKGDIRKDPQFRRQVKKIVSYLKHEVIFVCRYKILTRKSLHQFMHVKNLCLVH